MSKYLGEGCGKLIKGSWPCGDFLEEDTDEEGRSLGNYYYCDECHKKFKDKFICCLCKRESEGYGNNPAPLMEDTDKKPNRCCDNCNVMRVIPERIKRIRKWMKKGEKKNV